MLELLLELLQRVTNSLNDESLSTLRLTCKALETATLDRFVAVYLRWRHFYIRDSARWTLLKNLLSTRLSSRMEIISFTLEQLENGFRYDIQLALENTSDASMYADKMDASREKAQQALDEDFDDFARPDRALMHRVMFDIKRLAPNVRVNFDLWFDDDDRPGGALQQDLIFAAITNGLPLNSLMITDAATHFDTDLANCFGALDCFCYVKDYEYEQLLDGSRNSDEVRLGAIKRALSSANKVENLELHLGRTDEVPGTSLPAKMLLTVSFPQLESLDVSDAVCAEDDLVMVVSRCCSTLTRVRFYRTHLTKAQQSWQAVFLFSQMPGLRSLQIRETCTGDF